MFSSRVRWRRLFGSIAGARRQTQSACLAASPFQQHDVMPYAVQMPITLTPSDIPKSASAMKRQTGMIGGQDLGLQCPVSGRFGCNCEPFQQGAADALSSCLLADVDADLSDACCASRIRRRRQSGPAKYSIIRRPGCHARNRQVALVPISPKRRRQAKCGEPGREAVSQNSADRFPVLSPEGRDRYSRRWHRCSEIASRRICLGRYALSGSTQYFVELFRL